MTKSEAMLAEARNVIAELAAVADGHYKAIVRRAWWRFWFEPERGGWIWVSHDKKDGTTNLMWTTGRDTHRPTGPFGPAVSLSVSPSGNLVCYMESALSMWVKWGYGIGGESELRKALSMARWMHSNLCGSIKTTA